MRVDPPGSWVSSIQPGELVKITLAIFFAGYLATNRDNLVIGGNSCMPTTRPRPRPYHDRLAYRHRDLVLQRDLGTSLLFSLFVAMLYAATNRVSWRSSVSRSFAPAVAPAVRFSHVQTRFNAGCTPSNLSSNTVVPTSQQVFGQASGGLLRARMGTRRSDQVPLANPRLHSLLPGRGAGLTGMAAILILYLTIQRGLRAA